MHILKRILIKGYYGVDNLGDDMILNSICNSVIKASPDCVILVCGSGNRVESSVSGMLCKSHIKSHNLPKGIVNTLIFFREIDFFIYGGGGLFPNESIKQLLSTLCLVVAAKLTGVRSCLYGIEINPIKKGISKFLWRLIISFTDFIVTRNQQTAQLLKECGCPSKKIIKSSDCTFAYPDAINGEKASNIILWAPNSLFRKSELENKDVKARYERICDEFAYICDRFSSYKHVFLPFHPEFDEPYIKDITNRIKLSKYEIVDVQNMSVVEKRALFKHSEMCLCGRFHSIVFSLFYGIPFFAVSYSPKTSCLLKELGLTENYVEYGIRETNFFYEVFDLDFELTLRKIDLIISDEDKRERYAKISDGLRAEAIQAEAVLQEWLRKN